MWYNTDMERKQTKKGAAVEKKIEGVLRFIKDFGAENGYSPSVREICAALQIPSTASVYQYLGKLQKRGKLTKSPLKNRTIQLCGAAREDGGVARAAAGGSAAPSSPLSPRRADLIEVPHIGSIAAGAPLTAVENVSGVYPLPRELFKGEDLFMLTVKGDSMIGAGILDGDQIVLKSQSTAQNGDIVAALIGEEATVKRLYQKEGQLVLHPENARLADIILKDTEAQILGVAVGLIRKKI